MLELLSNSFNWPTFSVNLPESKIKREKKPGKLRAISIVQKIEIVNSICFVGLEYALSISHSKLVLEWEKSHNFTNRDRMKKCCNCGERKWTVICMRPKIIGTHNERTANISVCYNSTDYTLQFHCWHTIVHYLCTMNEDNAFSFLFSILLFESIGWHGIYLLILLTPCKSKWDSPESWIAKKEKKNRKISCAFGVIITAHGSFMNRVLVRSLFGKESMCSVFSSQQCLLFFCQCTCNV